MPFLSVLNNNRFFFHSLQCVYCTVHIFFFIFLQRCKIGNFKNIFALKFVRCTGKRNNEIYKKKKRIIRSINFLNLIVYYTEWLAGIRDECVYVYTRVWYTRFYLMMMKVFFSLFRIIKHPIEKKNTFIYKYIENLCVHFTFESIIKLLFYWFVF